jgi:hypothetical protein
MVIADQRNEKRRSRGIDEEDEEMQADHRKNQRSRSPMSHDICTTIPSLGKDFLQGIEYVCMRNWMVVRRYCANQATQVLTRK